MFENWHGNPADHGLRHQERPGRQKDAGLESNLGSYMQGAKDSAMFAPRSLLKTRGLRHRGRGVSVGG